MNRNENDFRRDLRKSISDLETLLGVPKNFFWNLRKDDDWAFIIKLHALMESAIARLVESYVPTEIHSFAERLSLSGRISKFSLLKACSFSEPFLEKFVKGLSKIRNSLVHDISNVGFNLKKYLSELSRKEIGDLAKQVFDDQNHIPMNPRRYLWVRALHHLASLQWRGEGNESSREIDKLKRRALELEAERARTIASNLKEAVSGLAVYREALSKSRSGN